MHATHFRSIYTQLIHRASVTPQGFKGLTFIIPLILLLALPAYAQMDYTKSLDFHTGANFGSHVLEDDPIAIAVVAGGPVDFTSNEGDVSCTGYGSTTPDVEIHYADTANTLHFQFTGDAHTVLVVEDQDGNRYCTEPDNEYYPVLTLEAPIAGVYKVWVGDDYFGTYTDGILTVTGVSVPAYSVTQIAYVFPEDL